MEGKIKTLAFQVSEELFGRIKEHLKKTGLSQKDFVIGLIEQALEEAETGKAGQTSGMEERRGYGRGHLKRNKGSGRTRP